MSEACLHMNPLAQPGGFPYGCLLRARAPRMLVTASARRGPVRTALGGVTGSHRRPSERAPRTVAPFRRWGARRAVRSRGEGVCPGAAAIDGAPPVCPGPRGAWLLCVWPLSSPQQRRQPRHQERGLSFLSAPPPQGARGGLPSWARVRAVPLLLSQRPTGDPWLPIFRGGSRTGDPSEPQSSIRMWGRWEPLLPVLTGTRCGGPCASLGRRGVRAQPQPPGTATLSCPEVGQGPSRRLRLLVPSRLGPAALLPSPVPLCQPLGVPPAPRPLPLVLAGSSLSFGRHQLTPDTYSAPTPGCQ